MSKGFYRKIAFGLGLNENPPSDPLGWALSQLDSVQDIDLMNAPSLNEQLEFFSKMREVEDKLTVQFKHSAVEYEEARQKNYNKFGTGFYHPLEIHIRHKAALTSNQPVFERMYHFWTNHFAVINTNTLRDHAIGPYQREVIRKNLTGSFNELVKQATTGFAMLKSLDNERSIGPNSAYVRKKKSHGDYKRAGQAALNENHARELLELHTVSPNAGYTQQDVIELAKVMSGRRPKYRKEDYPDWKNPVHFDSFYHEPGEKNILGKIYNSKDNPVSPKDELFQVIDDLCNSVHCKKFISHKLCRYFIDDNPTPDMVEYVIRAWNASKGQLPAIHKAVIELAYNNPQYNRKYLMPETWLLQSAKILDIQYLLSEKNFWNHDFDTWPRTQYEISHTMEDLGHHPFIFKQPNGYMDQEKEWISPEMTIRRLAYAKIFYDGVDYSHKKKSNIKEYFESVVYKNFDNGEEIIKDLFSIKRITSDLFTIFLNRPEVLRV